MTIENQPHSLRFACINLWNAHIRKRQILERNECVKLIVFVTELDTRGHFDGNGLFGYLAWLKIPYTFIG